MLSIIFNNKNKAIDNKIANKNFFKSQIRDLKSENDNLFILRLTRDYSESIKQELIELVLDNEFFIEGYLKSLKDGKNGK